jgi:hypothetical protein
MRDPGMAVAHFVTVTFPPEPALSEVEEASVREMRAIELPLGEIVGNIALTMRAILPISAHRVNHFLSKTSLDVIILSDV